MKLLTNSSISRFQRCPRAYLWRNERLLQRLYRTSAPLYLGSLVHKALETYYNTGDPSAAFASMAVESAQREPDPDMDILARVMVSKYLERYAGETLEPMSVEQQFEVTLRNPDTGYASRSFMLAGKVDMRLDAHTLMEHKTATDHGGTYIEKLCADQQIHMYAGALGCNSVIYNILRKCQNKRKQPSKQRTTVENDTDFAMRIDEWYTSHDDAFERVDLLLSEDMIDQALRTAWDVSQQILWCRREQRWPRIRQSCFDWHRPCQYWPLCNATNPEMLIGNEYEEAPEHPELGRIVDTTNGPVF